MKPNQTMGPLGFTMRDAAAKLADAALKRQSADLRSMFTCTIDGQAVGGYCRAFKAASDTTFDEGERADVSLITSASLDRDMEMMNPDGADWEAFLRNPVVTFAHDYRSLPVGRAMWVKRNKSRDPIKNGWKAKTQYIAKPADWPANAEWFPDAVWAMVKAGVLLGKSIGFIPLKWREIEEADLRKRPELARARGVIDEYQVIEYAVAPVQSNPDAVVEAVAKCKRAGLTLPQEWLDGTGLLLADDVSLDMPSVPALPDIDYSKIVTAEQYLAGKRAEAMKQMASVNVRQVVSDALADLRGDA